MIITEEVLSDLYTSSMVEEFYRDFENRIAAGEEIIYKSFGRPDWTIKTLEELNSLREKFEK